MYKIIFGLLVCLLYSQGAVHASTEGGLINKTTPFVVAVEKDYPPFLFFENDEVQGLSFDYLKLISKTVGREIRLSEPLQLNEMLESIKSGKTNILIDITKTAERDQYLEFSNSYIDAPAVVVARKNQISVWDGGQSNAGVTIAAGKSYGVVSFLQARYPKANIVEMPTDYDVLKSVALGAVDVGVIDIGSYSYLQKINTFQNLTVLGNTGFLYSLSFAVLEKDKAIIPQLNNAIALISEDDKTKIYSKWISPYTNEDELLLSTLTKEIVGGIFGFVVIVILWNLILQKKVKQRTSELEKAQKEIDESLVRSRKEALVYHDESESKTTKLEKTKKAMLNILEDIQQEKTALSLLTRKFKIATESAKIGVMEMDIAANQIYGDDITCHLYGVEGLAFECTFEKWMSFIHQDDRKRVSDKMSKSMQDGSMFEDIFRIIRPSGETRYIKGYAQIDFDEKHNPVKMVGVNYDVTHEKEVDLEKTEFVSLASHQLKTPIGSISWNLEMLENGDYGDLTDTQKEIVSEMYLMSRRMNELVNSLLNVSRIELGVFIIEPEPVDFGKLCDEVLLELKPRIETKKHEVLKTYTGNIQNIPADPKLLRIIFQNYLSNAVKYTQDHGKIEVKIVADSANVLVSVWNNGDPIPEKDKEKIFGKMFRASNAQAQDPDGNGLGLYLVKKIIENGGGKVWFESSKEKGTTFYISIPLTGMVRKEGTKKLD
jgi:signal transduction histidine kinase/ABC-type amino acid transport substrate-binding protein